LEFFKQLLAKTDKGQNKTDELGTLIEGEGLEQLASTLEWIVLGKNQNCFI
jgi:hypothetical protein